MKKVFLAAILVLGLILGYFLAQNKTVQQTIKSSLEKTNQEGNSAASEITDSSSESLAKQDSKIPANSEFISWVQSEAQELEKSAVDPQKIETELTARSGQLLAEEQGYLASRILEAASPANEKIFGIYLLSLNVDHNLQALSEVLKNDLNYPLENPTHSPEEVLSMQEKTLRRMAVDAIFEKAKTQKYAREQLEKLKTKSQSPYIRDYIKKKLAELSQ
ncbi:MAG: hypothetical protein ACLGGX_08800 [Bdellovibrionia bacterium]